jgi:hypothetical protein
MAGGAPNWKSDMTRGPSAGYWANVVDAEGPIFVDGAGER